jgi:hypothetical protein
VKLPLRRSVLSGIAAALILAASGCGSDASRDESQLLPTELGADLARQSDLVLGSLEDGAGCTARNQARALRADVEEAIGRGQVPPELEDELLRRSSRLVDSIECMQPPPPPPLPPPVQTDEDDDEEEDYARGKKGDRGKKKGHGGEDD